jgi:hypothetical protein
MEFMMGRNREFAGGGNPTAIHAQRVEWRYRIARCAQGNETGPDAIVRQLVEDERVGSFLELFPTVDDPRDKVVRGDPANENLALSGARDRAGTVPGVRACADDRAVPDAAGGLVVEAARRRCGGQMAMNVPRDRADRAVLLGFRRLQRVPDAMRALTTLSASTRRCVVK